MDEKIKIIGNFKLLYHQNHLLSALCIINWVVSIIYIILTVIWPDIFLTYHIKMFVDDTGSSKAVLTYPNTINLVK